MWDWILSLLQYFATALFYTLGAVVICGLIAYASTRLFVRLTGSGKFVYVTAVIGTPIHELGHALMCPFFAHKITDMRLLQSPKKASGTFGYVSHSYNKRNPWAILGNLFIGIGPILSGLGVTVLVLFLCFPAEWNTYLAATASLDQTAPLLELVKAVFSLLLSLPGAFADAPWRALIGIIVILFVAQHITLSTADIKGALSALPIYLALLLIGATVTKLLGVETIVLDALFQFHLWILSFFALTIAFCLVWLVLAFLIYLVRTLLRR